MKAAIKHQNLNDEFYTPELCFVTELSNSPDDSEVSIARIRVEIGVTTCWHQLKGTSERYYILSGIGRMEVGELSPQDVTVGDVVLIPSMCRQRITNIGTEDLVFLAICTPPFLEEVYVEAD